MLSIKRAACFFGLLLEKPMLSIDRAAFLWAFIRKANVVDKGESAFFSLLNSGSLSIETFDFLKRILKSLNSVVETT